MTKPSRCASRAALVFLSLSGPLAAQTPPASPAPPATPAPAPKDVSLVLTRDAGRRIPIAIPPAIAPLGADLQSQVVDPFSVALSEDLGGHPAFLVTDAALQPRGARPPQDREQADLWVASGAQYLLDTQVQPDGAKIAVVAQLWDLRTLKSILGKRYIGDTKSARRIAHTLANDVVKQFTGKPGPFLTQIAFVSDRDKKPGQATKEVYVMDWDGQNPRRATYGEKLSLAPDWFPDGKRLVYQSYATRDGQPALFVLSLETGDTKGIPVTTRLNASPSVSPDGKLVAYCGSVRGNPEVFVVAPDGSGSRRLTDSPSIDSTPRWASRTGEIAFTSNRQGSPQIFLMDGEGLNVRRVTFAGNWNDEAAFSPDGSRIAFACRNEGDFQICVMDLLSNQTVQISTGSGANENPTWSPDGSKIAWELTRGGSTQIVVAGADGSNPRVVTSSGNNQSPAWSKGLE